MKKVLVYALSLGLVFISASCGESSSVEVSSEMQGFMGMLTGEEDAVEKALEKYGMEPSNSDDMYMYSLEQAKVTGSNENCYSMEAKSGITVRMYDVCWEEGKITKVTDKGFK